MVERLGVWAERYEGFVRVGMLTLSDTGEERFSYDESYLRASSSVPIYPILPLSARPFGADTTRAAFSSLGPEGPVGRDVRIALRAGREAVVPVLGRLNHETVGALTFTRDDEEPDCAAVEPRTVDEDFLRALSSDSTRTAYETMLASRLSLNGAVAKVGVTRRGDTWFLPRGLEPSTHILKAGSVSYPDQMLNEALCMRCAVTCGFEDAARTSLITLDGCDPILVSERFDRAVEEGRPHGLSPVMRLHQADFCQVVGISTDALKYVPADELVPSYNEMVASAISRESSERYGDRSYVFEAQVFNYLLGNCDNHLKNLSMTWASDWSAKAVSPIYDVTCTTMYPELSRDMGLGIGCHRSIDAVEPGDFLDFARQMGVSAAQARTSLSDLAESFVPSLYAAADSLEEESAVDAVRLAEAFEADSCARIEVVRRAAT
ncbi:MAG: HipA domain-containing protein [Atopobiaceae bacterium]|nr:HipA domain-containing protein [Atopobiaceae bacterium]